jgi:hypothetical protein
MQISKPHLLALLACGLVFGSVAEGQEKDATAVTLTTPSRVALAGTYWESANGKESPVLVLMHGEGGNRKKWKVIAGGLQKKGYAVLTLDMRKHGDSPGAATDDSKGSRSKSDGNKLKASDYLAMIGDDMEAVKVFLMEKHHAGELNIAKTGFVAIGAIGAVAINAAAMDWARKDYPDGPPSARTPRGRDVKSVVLISPDSNVKGVKTMNGMKMTKLHGVNYLIVVGSKDKDKKKSADKIVKSLRAGLKGDAKEEQVLLKEYPVRNNGEDLVARDNRAFLALLAEFHDLKLKPVNQPWRDRRSKLDR